MAELWVQYGEFMKIEYCVYILCNRHRNVLYIGSASDLKKRIYFHKKRLIAGFSKRYNVDQLVYFELMRGVEEALCREKQLKGYTRAKKIRLIEKANPSWVDFYKDIKG
jgi:putative endonuclease